MNEPGELEYAWSIAEARNERICQVLEENLALRARVAKLEAALEEWRKELCSLCEDTEERYAETAAKDLEGKEGAYARGRIREAKSIRKAMGEVIYEDLTALKDPPQ
jgi:hypothetical protein